MNIIKNYCLKDINSFGIDVKAKYFAKFSSEKELLHLLSKKTITKEPLLILGDGTNILFTKNFEGVILANRIKGIKVIKDNKKTTEISVGAGENWHDFVLWSANKNLSGLENLALIPGLVGASPIQNIGFSPADSIALIFLFIMVSFSLNNCRLSECPTIT